MMATSDEGSGAATARAEGAPDAVRFATLSDRGTTRPDNEDACGAHVESEGQVLVAVADGVSGLEGGEIASRTTIDVTIAPCSRPTSRSTIARSW
jgi:hypothetical protein